MAMRRLGLLLAGIAGLLPGVAVAGDSPLDPRITRSTPRVIPAAPGGVVGISIEGRDLGPTAAQAGVTPYYLNTHGEEFYQLELRVETPGRLEAPVVCSTAPGQFARTGCSIKAQGATGMSIDVNPGAVPGWRQGMALHAVAQVMLHGATYRSGDFAMPFARGLGTPVVTGLSRTAYSSTDADWGLRISATGVDRTANLRIDGTFVSVGAHPDGAGNATLETTVPVAARSAGPHTVQVCTWALGDAGPGERASCSEPARYVVNLVLRRLPGGPALPAPQVVDPGTIKPRVIRPQH